MNLTDSVFLSDHLNSAKWTPKPGLILSGAGQCIETIYAMQKALGADQKPAVIALYESLNRNGYSQNPDIAEAHGLFPGAILQIGLQLPLFDKEGLLAVARGEYEQHAVRMARIYRVIGLPILLRIGYEFDGDKWNGYDPQAYIQAYRYLAGILRREGADNTALVWDSYTVDTEDVEKWFPGDDVVDWYGYNTISPRFSGPNNIVDIAQRKGKPVMNGEASYSQSCSHLSFSAWITQFFESLRNTGTSVYQYINWRWKLYPRSAGWNDWQDGRITEDPQRMSAYIQAMQGDDMVYRDRSYAQPICMIIDCARAMFDGEPDADWAYAKDHMTCESGFGYHISNCRCTYGSGWTTAWKSDSSLTLEINSPEAFYGELLIRSAAQGEHTLYVNGMKAVVSDGCGYLHIPMQFDRSNRIRIAGEACVVLISHVMVIRTVNEATTDPRLESGRIVWAAVDDALLYQVYCDYQLVEMTQACEYLLSEGTHVWHVAVCSRTSGAGKMIEVK